MLDPTKDSTKLMIVGTALLISLALILTVMKFAATAVGRMLQHHSKPEIRLVTP